MEIYTRFAEVYDLFMETPYGEWVNFIEKLWQDNGPKPALVMDLGCGTGSASLLLAERGYDMIGVDLSQDMLAIAREKAAKRKQDILFLNQDMRDFELYGTVDSIICLADGVNYIVEKKELGHVFKLVENYLNPGGLFIFDINTWHKYKNILGSGTFADLDDTCAYIWENEFDEGQGLNQYFLTLFIENRNTGLYHRVEEEHIQRAYGRGEIEAMLLSAGLEPVGAYNCYCFEDPDEDSEKITFVAQKRRNS